MSLFLALAPVAACGDDADGTGAGGAGASNATGGHEGVGAGGAGGSGGSGGGGGEGNASATGGSGGASGACTPGETVACYSGPAGTENVGLCKGGVRTCLADASAFGPCEGEVVPSAEVCASLDDEDCDGQLNEEGLDCACVPGTSAPCYTGAPSTQGVGDCVAGTHVCDEAGLGYGPCQGEVLPQAESCVLLGDEDCDGTSNEADAGCVCEPLSITSCYSGPPGTVGVGSCAAGAQMCDASGTFFGPCSGEILPQPELCATVDDDDCDGVAAALCPGGDHLWSKQFGGSLSDELTGLVADPFGDVFIAGNALSTIDFGGGALVNAGDWDIDLAKLDSNGNHLWSKRFGDAVRQQVWGIAGDTFGNVFVTGEFNGQLNFGGATLIGPPGGGSEDMYIAKFNAAGVHQWSARYGVDGVQNGIGVAADSSGNAIVLGHYQNAPSFGGSPLGGAALSFRVFVAKYGAASGAHFWSKGFGGPETYAAGIAVDSSDNVVIIGAFRGTVNFGGPPLTSANNLNTDIFVAKLDWLGNHVWSKRFGNTGQSAYSVAVDPADNVIVSGLFGGSIDLGGGPIVSAGSTDGFVVKLDPAGNHLWSKALAGAGYGDVSAVATDPAGNIVMTGRTVGPTDFGGGPLPAGVAYDSYVAMLDPNGGHLWSKQFAAVDDQWGLAVATDSVGNVFTGGKFATTIDLGGGPLTSAGGNDWFVAKLAP